jgi:HrpA-like RNA helicase
MRNTKTNETWEIKNALHYLNLITHEPGRIAEALGKDHHRVLLFGEMGSGKSTR